MTKNINKKQINQNINKKQINQNINKKQIDQNINKKQIDQNINYIKYKEYEDLYGFINNISEPKLLLPDSKRTLPQLQEELVEEELVELKLVELKLVELKLVEEELEELKLEELKLEELKLDDILERHDLEINKQDISLQTQPDKNQILIQKKVPFEKEYVNKNIFFKNPDDTCDKLIYCNVKKLEIEKKIKHLKKILKKY